MKAYELDEDWAAADRKSAQVQSFLNDNYAYEHISGDRYPSVADLDRGLY